MQMQKNTLERTNRVYITGTLSQIKDSREGEKDGVAWIAGTVIVTSGDNEIEVKYFSSAKTKDGRDNMRYANYLGVEKLLGQKVRVNGELSGRVWYNASQGQVINFNEVNASFFNQAKPNDEDSAQFEFGGFVVKPIYERYDKEQNLIHYEMEVGQANYSGETMHIVKFTVGKDNPNVVSAIERAYTKGTTIRILGDIRYEVHMDEVIEEVAFGDPIVKKFQSTFKNFFITSGKDPIIEDGLAYSADDIAKLESSYHNFVARLEEEAKATNEAGGSIVSNGPAHSSNHDRLL